MRKWFMNICIMLLLCMCSSNACAVTEKVEVYSAIKAGYATIDLQNNPTSGFVTDKGLVFVGVDATSQTGTLMKPYMYGQMMVGYDDVEHSQDATLEIFGASAEIVKKLENQGSVSSIINEQIRVEMNSSEKYGLQMYGYVKDPNEQWEVMFLGYVNDKNELFRNEIYAFIRLDASNGGTKGIANALIANQEAVGQIKEALEENGLLPEEMTDWNRAEIGNEQTEDIASMLQIRIRESGDVNVRAKPDAESARVGKATAGKTYDCLSVADNGWYEIVLEDGTVGFVSQKLATMIE